MYTGPKICYGPSGGGGSSQPQQTTQTQTTEPWDQQKPYLVEGYEQAQENVLDRPLEYFPGSTVVPFSPETEVGLGMQTNRAMQGSPIIDAAGDQITSTMRGDYLNQNPYLDQVGESVYGDVRRGADSQFSGAGRYGSTAHMEALGRGVGDAMAPYRFGAYESERDRQLGAVEPAFTIGNQDYVDASYLRDAGATRETLEAEKLQDEVSRFNFGQAEPTNRIAQYLGLVSGNQGASSTATTTASGNRGSGSPLATTALLLGSRAIPSAKPTIICTALHFHGYLDDKMLKADRLYAVRIASVETHRGYLMWAHPVAEAIRDHAWVAMVLAPVFMPAIRAMAQEATGEGESTAWGRFQLEVLCGFSRGVYGVAAFMRGLEKKLGMVDDA